MDSVLRPRDIQTRIRAGERPEDVAAAAQTTLDRIMGFAGPVMAERAHIAQQAQKASVRRRVGSGPVGVLGEAVASRLDDPEAVEWDAWRREDGRWTLVADYADGGLRQQARFVYDVAGRYVVADDEEARGLVGEITPTAPPATAPTLVLPVQVSVEPEPVAVDEGRHRAHDTGVGEARGDVESVLETRAPDVEDTAPVLTPTVRTTTQPADPPDLPLWEAVDAGEDDFSLTGDLTEASRAVQALPPPSTGDADWIVTQASERPAPRRTPDPVAADVEVLATPPKPVRPEVFDTLFEAPAGPETATDPTPSPAETPAGSPARPRTTKAKRAAVPSWDEIMFGTPKD